MMAYAWLIVAILGYFAFALASLGDKIILGQSPRPRAFTFFVGVFNILAVFLIPFIDFGVPTGFTILWIVLDAIIYIFGIYGMFSALEKFDVSRVIPAIGATQPIFIFLLTWIFWGPQSLGTQQIVAFVLLLLGTIIISVNRTGDLFTKESLKISLATALLFSMDFVFSKFVYLNLPFWQGFIWIRIISFIFALMLLIHPAFYKDVFGKKAKEKTKTSTGLLFVSFQAAGGIATILQSWAIALAPIAYLAIINALRGVQYVFLFAFTVACTTCIPKVLKEDVSKGTLIQKISAILVIALGLGLLFVNG
jgi:drug/metabolite transporter (DMT)-like permease